LSNVSVPPVFQRFNGLFTADFVGEIGYDFDIKIRFPKRRYVDIKYGIYQVRFISDLFQFD